jgi:Ca2+-binding RTX toxin-like protein
MVQYIKSDLDFILAQIKIAEAHAGGQPLYGAGGLIPTYNLAWGLRTVDGTYNNLLPGREQWGAADNEFNELLTPEYRTGEPMPDMDGPGPMPAGTVPTTYAPSNDPNSVVFDSSLRTISNLIVDQTLGNPAAILTALQRAGIVAPEDQMVVTAQITAAFEPIEPLFTALNDALVASAAASAAAAANPGDQALADAAAAAAQVVVDSQAALDGARAALDALLEANGIELDGANVALPNIAPDEGLSAPFNSWFTLFGQFFDHGLDLVNKGGSGTVFVPLMPDDPLYDPTSHTNFMVLTRATVSPGADGVMGTADDVRPVNTTTSFVDQNQTYTSHSSHQVFLREYVLNAAGDPVATGKLIEGDNGGMATWADVKEQARTLLGIQLVDSDVGNIPLLAADQYGKFIPGPNGFPQMVFPGVNPGDPLVLVEGDPSANGGLGVLTAGAIRTGHAFLADIAHNAVPTGLADGDIEIGLGNPDNSPTNGQYDNELLDAHYIAGDGRANENIGLTAVHHVFHSEHNRLMEHTKEVVLATGDLAFINEWLADDLAALPTPAQVASLVWDGERLFQAAKFGTEMQYQHLVFEEFARKIQPNINVFLVPDGYDVTIDPSIVAEFAHVVYRFGHSMLTETIDRFDPNFNDDHIGLIEGFLNPIQFDTNGGETVVDAGISAGAIIRGMTRQAGNQIDEFVTGALRNNLLGLPLDLATINLARGRDTGVPSLNAARRDFYEATNDAAELKPYESWVDFAGHLKNEASIINFVAAYGTHELITGEATIEGKRDAALTIITGVSVGGMEVPADRLDFLNAVGAYAGGALGGLENVDLWIGGLAEATMPFGGMLGSTFNFVFETQMESLQNGDRFYYLQRLDGLHLFGEMEGNSFAAMIMRNTDATHLPSDVFSTPGLILEVDRTKQYNPDLGETAGNDGILLDDPTTAADESADNLGNDPVGGGLLTQLVIRNNPATPGTDTNYLRYTGGDHVVLGGTEGADILVAGIGDDTLFGDGGNDNLDGGFGNDIINGGDGDDIIRDTGGDDNIKGGAGNDVIHAGPGLDLVLAGAGQDFVVLGTDMGSEVFGGEGNDFILGNKNAERLLGNEGDDWLETGTFDGAPGDNFDEIFAHDGIDGNDVFLGDGGFDEFIGEGGDDIMVGSPGRGKMAGMSGFDWVTYKDNGGAINADLSIPIIFDEAPTLPQNAALDEFESMEGLSGTRFDDILTGSNEDATTRVPLSQGGSTGYLGSALDAQGIALINGLQAVLGAGVTSFLAGDILLGGDGSDTLKGLAGDDIIDGDKWLDVQIGVFAANDPNHTGTPIALHNSMKTLATSMFSGAINPAQLGIVRTIRTADGAGDVDTAVYSGLRGEYAFSGTDDGQVVVSHVVEDALDGTDRLRNVERVQFLDGGALNVIVGTPGDDVLNGTAGDDLILGLAGNDVLNGFAGNDILVGGSNNSVSGTYADNFNNQSLNNSTGASPWTSSWVESGDNSNTNSASQGQIRIDNGNSNTLQFRDDDNDTGNGTATIQRVVNLAGATTATLSYDFNENSFDNGEIVTVQFSANGLAPFTTLQTIDQNSGSGSTSVALTGPFTANAVLRFVVSGTNNNSGNDIVSIDNLAISFSGTEVLNGGLGDDTYTFGLGDGNDTINEAVNATSGGTADRISILSTTIDPVTLLPVITALNANDSNTGTNNGDLVISYTLPTGTTQTTTVAGHFTGTTAGTGVERINFNNATYAGYLLGTDDYLVGRLDPNNRDAGGVDLSASAANNFLVGEQGVNDEIIGGLGNDLIFGGTGDNELSGGDGDDLLVGGSGGGDDDLLDGGLGADTMVGLGGDDTYVVDDLLDVAVEAAGAGDDTVETEMAELSIELMANVEDLTYTGVDADQFVGTGNSLDNVISGGDLADTLSGLAGNDTLIGGLGADTMTGGDGNDVYEVDEAGDVVVEGVGAASGVDRVEADIDYTLGANVENLDLNAAAVRGTGNALDNVINGNDENNELFGAGGNDTLNGDDGDDLLDGGLGNDTLNGGDDNDTIIGGGGNDTIDVGGGVNTIIYNSVGFGADVINSFDATGGTPANQDRIDLSGLGVTAASFANRVFESAVGGNTLITIRENGPASAVVGTIQINGVNNAGIDISDFTLAAPPPPPFGAPTAGADTIDGNGAANTIDGLGGNDTLNGEGGNDVISGGEGADTLNGGDGNDTLAGGVGSDSTSAADAFGSASYGNNNGGLAFAGNWTEGGGETTSPTGGDIAINGGRLQFNQNVDGGETIQRSVNLAGATAATLTFAYEDDNLGAGQSVIVEAWNIVTSTWEALAGGTLGSTTGNGNGTFSASLSANQIGATSAIRLRTTGDGNNWDNGDNFYVDDLTVSVTQPGLNAGVDIVNGDGGDDTIVWHANETGSTDGRDLVDGGTEGVAGDTFVVNGNASAETYRVYTRAEALAAGMTGLAAGSEIVVTRNGTDNAAIIAELSEIEEIRINGADPAGNGSSGGDIFELIGDFSGTQLRLNTVTIDGEAGDDTIDISALSSAHRIIFRGNGGHDTIIGAMRPQDVIELPLGASLDDYDLIENADGTKTLSSPTHSVTFETTGTPNVHVAGGHDDDEDDEDEDDDDDEVTPPVPGLPVVGTAGSDTLVGTTGADELLGLGGDDVMVGLAGADVLMGGGGSDFINGWAGRDIVFAGEGDDTLFGGDDADMLYGEGGADRIFGDAGDDLIEGGAGNDTAVAGAGNDMIVAGAGDGNDVYFGDEIGGGTGSDTLDMSAITAATTVDLGTGLNGHGSASSAQSGSDTLWGIENVATGSGNDRITAGNGVNIIDGGGGNDIFVFRTVEAANGDTIVGFEAGDRIDFSAIDANTSTGGNQTFTLVAGSTATGQVSIIHETRADGDYTVIQGNVDGDGSPEFRISLQGSHNLTAADFNL